MKTYNVYAYVSYGNTLLTITSDTGKTLKTISAGTVGFNKARRSSPFAALQVSQKAGTWIQEDAKAEKANESSERTLMKGEDASSKAIEKAEKLKLKKKKTVTKKVEDSDCESLASTVLMTDSEGEEEPHVRFQNVPLITEINSIRDVKKFKNWKKLSAGVKLARQILDI